MPDPRISEDTILLVARLINEAEDMKTAANDALKDTWADHRETLKSLGLSGKEISAEVAQFKAAIAENRLTATEADKRDQKAEGKDEYLAILTSPRARARKGQSNTTQNTSNSGPDDEENEPESTTPQKRIAALRADPAMAIVEAANLKPEIKPQPTKAAGSDLTSLSPHEGQVATHPVANVEEDANGAIAAASEDPASREVDDADRQQLSSSGLSGEGEGGLTILSTHSAASATVDAQEDAAGVRSSAPAAPKYAEPGVVVWEHTPPEPVRRHPYSAAFGDLGQDLVVIDDDIAGAKSEPIVRIGNEILDGWARYNVARGMIGGSGMSTEYPVVQYAGTDPLIDCIKWNVAGRVLSPKDKQTIVSRLSAIEPKRKAEIIKAMAELAI